jgi:hypothetical protein
MAYRGFSDSMFQLTGESTAVISAHIPSRTTVLIALAALCFVDVTLNLRGFAWLRRQLLQRRTQKSYEYSVLAQTRLVAAVDRAAVYYPRETLCLQRSLTLTWLLRRHGIPAQMVIGCRHTPFYAHAWVEVHGQIVNDKPSVVEKYPEMERI